MDWRCDFFEKSCEKIALENFLLKNDIFFAKKFAKYNLFIVSLQRRSKEDRARKRDVRSANEMRSFFEGCLMLND